MLMIDNIDSFLNSVNKKLENFIKKEHEFGELHDVYCAFSFNTVQRTFDSIESGNLENKPVIHLHEDVDDFPQKFKDNLYEEKTDSNGKVERMPMVYNIFCVINESYKGNRPRKHVLNEITDGLRNKFNRNKDELPEFRNIRINISEGFLTRNAENLYASQQVLSFDVYKSVD